jgi:hypothetical protein
VEHDLVLLGGPVVEVGFTTSAPDVPLSVRMWDVAEDGSEQGLVTRGTYRVAEGPGDGVARFQLAPQGYRFPAGHRVKVEVVANDAPYYQASNVPAVVEVERLEVTLPLHERPGTAADDRRAPGEQPGRAGPPGPKPPPPGTPPSSPPAAAGTLPTTGAGSGAGALLLVAAAVGCSRRRPDASVAHLAGLDDQPGSSTSAV